MNRKDIETLISTLNSLDDHQLFCVIQHALFTRNKRNNLHPRDAIPKELAGFLTEESWGPALFVLALASNEPDPQQPKWNLNAIGMNSVDQMDKIRETAADPTSWIPSEITDHSSYHEEGVCAKCKLVINATVKQAYCPICAEPVSLT